MLIDVRPNDIPGLCHRPRRLQSGWSCTSAPSGRRAVRSLRLRVELLVERARLASALVKLPDLTPFKTWAPHVARFSFLLAPVTGGDRSPNSSGNTDDVPGADATPSTD